MDYGLLGLVKERELPAALVARWKHYLTWGTCVVQHPGEMAEVWKRLQEVPPERFLELGSEGGGSLYVYAGACAYGARIVVVDKGEHRSDKLALTLVGLEKEGFDVTWVQGNTHAPKVMADVQKCFTHAIEFLHIDAGHTLEDVSQDFEDYAPIVRDGGLIALHDVGYGDVQVFWESSTFKGMDTKEIILPQTRHIPMGIGLVRKPLKEREDGRDQDRGDVVRS